MDFKLRNEDAGTDSGPMKSNMKLIIGISSAVVVAIILIFIAIAVHINKVVSQYDSLILPGVSIEEVNLTGKTKEEAISEIENKYDEELSGRNIKITAGDNEYSLPYTDINVQYNIEDTVNDAFNYNRDLGKVKKYSAIKKAEAKNFDLQFTYDEQPVDNLVSKIENEVNVEKKNATITKSGSGFAVTDHVVGKKLDTEGLLNELKEKIASTEEGDVEVEGKISDEMPSRTKEQLDTINKSIGTYSTSFGTPGTSRATNISVGARAVNGTVLMPGESFSFNTVVGDTTPDKGYQKGGVYVGSKLEQGYGGGICQVSSTLYNAVLQAGILPDERTNHSMPVSYVPAGLDATISYGYLDYVFTNPFEYPIYIEGYTSGSNVAFNVYSNSSVNEGVSYSFVAEKYATIPVPTTYEDDPNLPAGQESVVQAGQAGCKAKAYRITYTNGTETNRELMNDDTYNPYPRIVKRGTKK